MSNLEPVHLHEDETTGDRFLIYGDGAGLNVEISYDGDRLWMTQAQIADLFGRDVSTISRHIASILEEEELDESNLHKTQIASSTKPVTFYSLDMVISVGYRVASKQATLFRKWATETLVQFATKGFVIDAARLKNPQNRDRIAELKEIIREVCAERDAPIQALETMPDHVHLLVTCDPQYGIHRLVKQIKGRSSRLLRQEFPSLRSRLPTLWTNSYFVATTGGAPFDLVKRYVENQKNA